jgi:hypothetical protein
VGVAQLQGISANANLYTDVGPGDSGWQDGSSIAVPFSIETLGIVGADRVQVRGSNSNTQPDAKDIGAQIGSDISTNAFTAITVPSRWYRLIRTVKTGGGSVTARFFGFRPPAS